MRQTNLRTPQRRLTGALLITVALLLWLAGPVSGLSAQPDSDGSGAVEPAPGPAGDIEACPADLDSVAAADSRVHVAKVAGLLDPVVADYLLARLDTAEADPDAVGFLIWINSKGSVLPEERYLELADRLRQSPVQVGFWVGQPGSTAQGGAAELATVADLIGVTPNSTIGRLGERRLPAEWGSPFEGAPVDVTGEVLSAGEAIVAGVALGPEQNMVPIGSFATFFDGFETLACLDDSDNQITLPRSQVQLSGLSLSSQLFHTAASPEVAYLFLALGLGLLVFELFTAGVGVAGVIGAGFVTLGGFGLAVLPTRWWAIALILLSFVLLSVDIQTNVPRFYTVAGLVVFVVGSWFLYDGVSISWVTLGAVWIGALLYAYTGMPSMVRTRFSTPTIGRKWMIGELGEAVTDVDPEGTIKVRDVTWRAITNRATPVRSGGRVRVVGIDRLLLEIEPEEGGARDYRERS